MPTIREISSQSARFPGVIGVCTDPFSVTLGENGSDPECFSFTSGIYSPDFVVALLRRGLAGIKALNQEKVLSFRVPNIDAEAQSAYLASLDIFEPIEASFSSTQRQFLKAESALINNASGVACDYFKSLSERKLGDLREKLGELNTVGLEALRDALPYHLASILRLFDSARRSKEKLEHLQHFFEAASTFHTALLFSSLQNVQQASLREFSAIDERLSGIGMSIKRSTFGSWNLCVEAFPAIIQNEKDSFFRLRTVTSLSLACSPKVLSAMRFACQARNSGTGHGGWLNEANATKAVTSFMVQLSAYLEQTSELWADVVLIKKVEIKDARAGKIFYSVNVLTGVMVTPREEQIELIPDPNFSDGLDDGVLYFYSRSHMKAFRAADIIELSGPYPGDVMLPIYFNRSKEDSALQSEYKCYSASIPTVIRHSAFIEEWPSMRSLSRFVQAQEKSYQEALLDLKSGKNIEQSIWWIFPRLRVPGLSHYSNFYGLADEAEALAYLEHQVLGSRFKECVAIVKTVICDGGMSPQVIAGRGVEVKELRSSLELFMKIAHEEHADFRSQAAAILSVLG
jgi:uncharacterized protein (DUF1810 family)